MDVGKEDKRGGDKDDMTKEKKEVERRLKILDRRKERYEGRMKEGKT